MSSSSSSALATRKNSSDQGKRKVTQFVKGTLLKYVYEFNIEGDENLPASFARASKSPNAKIDRYFYVAIPGSTPKAVPFRRLMTNPKGTKVKNACVAAMSLDCPYAVQASTTNSKREPVYAVSCRIGLPVSVGINGRNEIASLVLFDAKEQDIDRFVEKCEKRNA